jgi:hypothetical protein
MIEIKFLNERDFDGNTKLRKETDDETVGY